MRTAPAYAVIALAAYLLLFEIGLTRGMIYVDPVFISKTAILQKTFIAPITVSAITVASIFTFSYREVQTYLTGILIIVYGFLFIGTVAYPALVPYSGVALASEFAFFAKSAGFNRRSASKLAAFVSVVVAMFVLGSSLRLTGGPPQYPLAFGSIYDDIHPGGVPLMFTGGVVIYRKFYVLSISVPIIILFTALSLVLTENYYLIFSLLRTQGYGGVRKTMSSALTVLSCQCEGITAYFPAAIATILLTAIIPLITESIVFILMTDILLTAYYIRGKRVRVMDMIWNVTKTRPFFAGMVASLFLIPLYTVLSVYFDLQENLLVFSSLNILMFVYGVFVVFISDSVLHSRKKLSSAATLILLLLSTAGMLAWYYPSLTMSAVSSPEVFSIMSIVTVVSGILSGIIFRMREEPVKRLYFEYVTMMFSMLAIVVFYITAIPTSVIWPIFGIRQQLEFSLILWSGTLPLMWLSTNISLNADSVNREKGEEVFLLTRKENAPDRIKV